MEKEQVRGLLNIEKSTREYLFSKNSIVQDRDLDGLFHPSSIGYCSRKLQYHHLCEQPIKKISSSTYAIFDMGHAVHDLLQARLGRVLKGRFQDLDSYNVELSIERSINDTEFAKEHTLAGSADGHIMIFSTDVDESPIASIIYEAKSISSKGWDKLTSPMIKHRMQASIYAKCLEAPFILFEYYCKNNSRSKWFLVDIDEDALSTAMDQITKVRRATESLKLVPQEGSMYECTDCAYLELCKPEGIPL